MPMSSTKPSDASCAPTCGSAPAAVPGVYKPADFYQSGTFSRDNSVGYLMRRITQIMVSQVDRRLDGHGLTHAQWTPLFLIHRGQANTLAALARDLQVDAGALTRTLDRLEAKGLCTRERSKEDRRVVHLTLTPAGVEAISPVPKVLCEVSNALLMGFSQEDWQTLMVLLRRIAANAEELRDVMPPHSSEQTD
jgi:DNA-binding MarR family transcriptional regulator